MDPQNLQFCIIIGVWLDLSIFSNVKSCENSIEKWLAINIRYFSKKDDPLPGHQLKWSGKRFRTQTSRTGWVTCTLCFLYIDIDYHATPMSTWISVDIGNGKATWTSERNKGVATGKAKGKEKWRKMIIGQYCRCKSWFLAISAVTKECCIFRWVTSFFLSC